MKCILSQDFSIFVSNKGDMLGFNDCSESYSESQQQLLNEKQTIELDQPTMKLLFKKKEYIELSSPSNKQPLRELIQTITKAEELRDTQVIGWRPTNAIENTVSISISNFKNLLFLFLNMFLIALLFREGLAVQVISRTDSVQFSYISRSGNIYIMLFMSFDCPHSARICVFLRCR